MSTETAVDKLNKVLGSLHTRKSLSDFQFRVLEGMVSSCSSKLSGAMDAFHAHDQRDQLVLSLKSVALDAQMAIWTKLFDTCSTKQAGQISRAERSSLGLNKSSLVYGEISFSALGKVLWSHDVQVPSGGVFYDLGSGSGRGVYAAALLHQFDRVVGIEVLSGLYNAALKLRPVFEKLVESHSPGGGPDTAPIELVRHDFLSYDWSDGSVVLINSTCFGKTLMSAIAKKIVDLRPGALVITLTKSFESPWFDVVKKKAYPMSWGHATVFVHCKRTAAKADHIHTPN